MQTPTLDNRVTTKVSTILLAGSVSLILTAAVSSRDVMAPEEPTEKLVPGLRTENDSAVEDLIDHGRRYVEEKKYDLAAESLTRALQYGKHAFQIYVHRSRAYVGLKRYQEALADAAAAIVASPNDHHGYGARALAYWHMNRLEESLADFTRAIELAPSKALLYSMRAAVYLDFGQPEKALDDLSHAIKLGYDKAVVLQRRAIAFNRLGRYEEAMSDLTYSLKRDPSHVGSLMLRGSAHRCLEQYKLAKADLDHALQIQPDHLESRLQRAFVSLETSDLHSALEDLSFAEKKGMKDPYLFVSLAYVSYRLGDMTRALKANDQALGFTEEKTRLAAIFQKGILLLVQGQIEEAQKLLAEGGLLAEKRKDLDNLEDALEELRRLQEDTTVSPEILNRLYGELMKTYDKIPPVANRPHPGCQARK